MKLEDMTQYASQIGQTIKDMPSRGLESIKHLGESIYNIPETVRNLTWEDYKAAGRKYRRELALSAVSTTAILAVSNPIQVAADTGFAELLGITSAAINNDYFGKVVDFVEKLPLISSLPHLRLDHLTAMTNEKSIGGKMGMALMMYGGFGLAYDKLRAKSRRFFGIPEATTTEIKKRLNKHDFCFTFLYSSCMMTAGYHIFGEHDPTKLANAVFVNLLTQPKRGPWIGAAVDMSKDLMGFGECKRIDYPQCIKKLGRGSKIGVFLAGAAASVALMFGEYSITPKEWSNPHRQVERWNLAHYLESRDTK